MLICPVRACGHALIRQAGRLVCVNGHSFDFAKSGYINLLQPQERRSKLPGDTAAAVAARRRLHDLGVTAPLLEALLAFAKPSGEVLDVGCGEGFYLGSLPGISGHGIDISTTAIDSAARRYPHCEWIVGNADRFLPYADQSFSMVLSITARRNADEFVRILKPEGRLLIAVPSPDDLIEIRGKGRDRMDATCAEFAGAFHLLNHQRVTTASDFDAEAVRDIRQLIYMPLCKERPSAMRLTFSLDLLLFQTLPMR